MEPPLPPDDATTLVQWQDFQQGLTRLLSLSSALRRARHRKQLLQAKLHSLIQDEAESLNRSDKLEQMCQKLEARRLIMEKTSTNTKLAVEDAKTRKQSLTTRVRSLLVAGAALSASRKRLQDSSKLISGEKGYIRLARLQRMLRARQQHMISQVSLLYPVKVSAGPPPDQELESSKAKSSFTDAKEVQSFAAALGYVAHAVSLVASYLNVPLRYPLRLCGSHSYTIDTAPSVESTSPETPSTSLPDSTVKHVEFPLFLEGQDTARAAHALLLLNKDLEQLLNFIGTKSLGPRHLLANLKELLRIIQSADFLGS